MRRVRRIYVRKRWSHSAAARTRATRAGDPIQARICGACRRRTTGVPHGFVHVDGEFVRTHRDDVVSLLKSEAARAAKDNPLAQIVSCYNNGHPDDVLITDDDGTPSRSDWGVSVRRARVVRNLA